MSALVFALPKMQHQAILVKFLSLDFERSATIFLQYISLEISFFFSGQIFSPLGSESIKVKTINNSSSTQ